VTDRDAFGNPIGPGGTPPATPTAVPPPPPAPPGTGPVATTDADTLAWMSLGCSIGGWIFIPFFLPIAAIFLARRARPRLGAGAPRSATTAALWIAWANIVLCLLFFAFVVVIIATAWNTNDF
jgi:hypothetical protein